MPRRRYAHMRQWETIITDRFIQKKIMPGNYTYDVHLKVRESPLPEYMSENERLLWNRITAKRIDIVIKTMDTIYVCEVKDRLRPSAIGQALTYKTLYKEQFKPTKKVIPAIICEYTDLDMLHVAKVYNIIVWRV